MRTSRSSRAAGAGVGIVTLVALLALGARPAAAQYTGAAAAQDTAPIALIVAVFPDTTAANQAVTALPAAQAGNVESYAVLSKDNNGKVSVQEHQGKKGSARAKKSLDAISAWLGRTPSGGRSDSTGNAAGSQGGVSAADLTQIQNAVAPGDAAVVLVVDDPGVDGVGTAMQQAHAEPVLHIKLVPVP